NERPLIGVASGNGEKSFFGEYNILRQFLEGQYEFKSVYFNNNENSEAKDEDLSQFKLLVIPGPMNDYNDDAKQQIKSYVEAGGKLLYMADGTFVDQQNLSAQNNPPIHTDFLSGMFGVSVNQNIVYDYGKYLNTTIPTENG